MHIKTSEIVERAERVANCCLSRNPFEIADTLGIVILERAFKRQLGVYKVVESVPFIFVKADLNPVLKKIVVLHEEGHHVLHSDMLDKDSFITDSKLFGMNNRMEYEANLFAAQISLPDDEFIELLEMGYSVDQIAKTMLSDPNLIALKVELLNRKGFHLNRQEFKSKFLSP